MNKRFKVVAVKQSKEGFAKGDLVLDKSGSTPDIYGGVWRIAAVNFKTDKFWQAYDLIFVSDEEPAIGNWAYDSEQSSVRQIRSDYSVVVYDKKIHFSTVPAHNVPLIPDSFKQTWVDRQGDVSEVEVEYELEKACLECHNFGDPWDDKFYHPKLINNSISVTVVENQSNQNSEHPSNVINFQEWFKKKDKEYKSSVDPFKSAEDYAQYYHASMMISHPKNENIEQLAHDYAKKKKLEIGGIDTWAIMDIYKDGINASIHVPTESIIKEVAIDFLDGIRAYERESHNLIGFDERESEEFFEIYKSGNNIIPKLSKITSMSAGKNDNACLFFCRECLKDTTIGVGSVTEEKVIDAMLRYASYKLQMAQVDNIDWEKLKEGLYYHLAKIKTLDDMQTATASIDFLRSCLSISIDKEAVIKAHAAGQILICDLMLPYLKKYMPRIDFKRVETEIEKTRSGEFENSAIEYYNNISKSKKNIK